MSNPLEKGGCDNNIYKKKGVFDNCVICRCCEALTVCIFKKLIHYQNKSIDQNNRQSSSNNNHSDVSESKQKKIKLNRTTIYHGRYRMSLSYELYLCDDGNILSKKDNSLKIGEFFWVEAKNCDEIPNNGWNMADMEIEGRKLMGSRKIFKEF